MSSGPTSAQQTPNPALVRADCDCPDIDVVFLMNAILAYSRRLQIYRNRNSGALVKMPGRILIGRRPTILDRRRSLACSDCLRARCDFQRTTVLSGCLLKPE